MRKFTRNLSRMTTPWVLVAAMVVSEMKDRLSPNMAPPTTVATHSGREKPPFRETSAAMGTSTVMVPTLVPIAMEMRQAMRNSPGTANRPGRTLKSRLAVLTAPPAALAMPLKAPASRKMKSMMVMLSSPMPWAQRWIFSSKERVRFWARAAMRAMEKATTTDMM